jgi:hypothetical protein
MDAAAAGLEPYEPLMSLGRACGVKEIELRVDYQIYEGL